MKKNKICDPEQCEHCVYLGEGDFACDDNDFAIVIENWEPTDDYMICEKED